MDEEEKFPLDKVQDSIDASNYALMKKRLELQKDHRDIYEYWHKEEGNKWIYHILYEFIDEVLNDIEGPLGLRPTFFYYVKTPRLRARYKGWPDYCFIRMSTGFCEKILKVSDITAYMYRLLPDLPLCVNNKTVLSPDSYAFLFGMSSIIFHEIGHATQFPSQVRDFIDDEDDVDQRELSDEEKIESHVMEWDADNFSSALNVNFILFTYQSFPAECRQISVLNDLVACAMVGIFLVHNELSGGDFEVYELTGAHPCPAYRIVNYCSRLTTKISSLGFRIDEAYVVNSMHQIAHELVGEKFENFMNNMKLAIENQGNDYMDIIQMNYKTAQFELAYPKVLQFLFGSNTK